MTLVLPKASLMQYWYVHFYSLFSSSFILYFFQSKLKEGSDLDNLQLVFVQFQAKFYLLVLNQKEYALYFDL